MKGKLIELGLSDDLADKILDALATYQATLKEYDRPKGQIAFQKNLQEIEQLCTKLDGKLSNLTRMERQFLDLSCNANVFELQVGLTCLTASCRENQKKQLKFTKRSPFLLDLTITLWKLLEANGIPVKVYQKNMLCKVLTVLFPLPEHDQEEDVLPDDLWAFHLLRDAKERIRKLTPSK